MVDHGIKPCYIFDGKPPELKGGVVSYQKLVQCPSSRAAGEAIREAGGGKGRRGGGKGDRYGALRVG
jgi:hypothetical protein